jgi:hypothetical protein
MKNFCSFILALFVLLIAGPRAAAQCTTEAPTISTGDYVACGYHQFQATTLGDEVLDADDVLRFVIHDGTAGQLGNILASYPTSTLSPLPPSLQLGVTYQVAAKSTSPIPAFRCPADYPSMWSNGRKSVR